MQENGRIRVDVEDEGVGFDPIQIKEEGTKSRGMGPFGIQERFSYFGGSMEIDSAPGRGSRFKLITPPISLISTLGAAAPRLQRSGHATWVDALAQRGNGTILNQPNPLGDPPALPERQHKFDKDWSVPFPRVLTAADGCGEI
jgi:hypothetical protein